jgi:hypothetical protein
MPFSQFFGLVLCKELLTYCLHDAVFGVVQSLARLIRSWAGHG